MDRSLKSTPVLPVDPDSDTGRLILSRDWSTTPLGPAEHWPQTLRTALSIVQGSRFPMALLWGPQRIQLYNDAYVPIYGRKHPQSLGQPAVESWGEVWDLVDPMFAQVEREARPTWSTDLLLHLDRRGSPEECYFTFSHSPIRGESGAVEGIFVTAMETTESVLALRNSVAARIAVLERMEDGFIAVDRDWRVTYLNAATERYLGRSREELCGRRAFDQFPSFPSSSMFALLDRAMREQTPVHSEAPALHRSGVREVHAYPSPEGLSIFFRDVTQQREAMAAREVAEAQLRESEQRYRSVFDNNPMPMWLYDTDSLQIIAVNRAAVKRYGYSEDEFVSMRITELRPKEEVPKLLEALRQAPGGAPIKGLFIHRYRDGSLHDVEVTTQLVELAGVKRALVVANDVSELKRLEEQFHHSQKMEAIGQLAGGIAHDFNNLLAVISTNVRLALEELPPGSELCEAVTDANDATRRAIELTRQLLMFSRRQAVTLEQIDLNHLVQEAERMWRRVIREDIVLTTRLASKLAGVRADRGQLDQVLMNLVVNARDAMPTGGELCVETAEREIPSEKGPLRFAQIVVRDTGQGMDAATLERIFEPFFTTKPVGKGTGLGLATVYGLVKQLGGTIEVESAPGKGTTFRLLIPCTADVEPDLPVSVEEDAVEGTELILVVEDEAAVRAAIARILTRRGYRVLEAGDGVEALDAIELHHAEIGLVLTDLVMPRMGGRDLAGTLRTRHPALPVLIMSGYDPEVLHPQPTGASVDILKPFPPLELLRRVRTALGRANGGQADQQRTASARRLSGSGAVRIFPRGEANS